MGHHGVTQVTTDHMEQHVSTCINTEQHGSPQSDVGHRSDTGHLEWHRWPL